MSLTSVTSPISAPRVRLSNHLSLFRLDHSVKQIFVIPGIVVAASLTGTYFSTGLVLRIALGLASVVAVASSNYVLNELLDAPFDRLHPTKCFRPAAVGSISKAAIAARTHIRIFDSPRRRAPASRDAYEHGTA